MMLRILGRTQAPAAHFQDSEEEPRVPEQPGWETVMN